VGEGDDRVRLESLAAELGPAGSVSCTGFVSDARKVELLQQMWVMATTSSKEGWGLTVLEANACGTPVVASDVPGLRDAVRDGETGTLYPYGDVPALAARIVKLLRDVELRTRLGENAIAWAKTFDWDVAADRALEVLEQRVKNP
jgi:glycosyltransferase involved in cell wall biosynthesis